MIDDDKWQPIYNTIRSKYSQSADIEMQYNEEIKVIEVYQFKDVVNLNQLTDKEIQISIAEAQQLDPEAQVDDNIGILLEEIDPNTLDDWPKGI